MVHTLTERSSRTISAREIPLTSFTSFLSLLYRNENPCYSISWLNMFCSKSSRSSVFTSRGSRGGGGFCGGRSLNQSKPFRVRFWMVTFRSCIPSISFSILSCWDIRIASSRTVVAIYMSKIKCEMISKRPSIQWGTSPSVNRVLSWQGPLLVILYSSDKVEIL